MRTRPSTLVILFLLCSFTLASAQSASDGDQIVETQHRITLSGQTLQYTARAGLLPIRDNETGDIHARMFFIAYTVERTNGHPPRPLTFLWNGGPGMNSSLIHLLGFGPRRVKTGDVYPTSPPPSETEMVDNEETWLDWTDLVFVDPIGTGYSRPTKAEYASEFYQTREMLKPLPSSFGSTGFASTPGTRRSSSWATATGRPAQWRCQRCSCAAAST